VGVWVLFKIVVVLAVILVWVFIQSADHCPSCGIELAERIDLPGERVDYCPCGWHRVL
jgi:hypothetical protein